MKRGNAAWDLIVFFATIIVAVLQGWQAKDLIWSLWISSLTLGYLYILISIVSQSLSHNSYLFAGSNVSEKPASPELLCVQSFFFNIIILIIVLFAFGMSWVAAIWLIPASLSILTAAFLLVNRSKSHTSGKSISYWARISITFPQVVFMLFFFTIHFGGFHFVHSIFLNGFFPLIKQNPFGKTPDEILLMITTIVKTAIIKYWPFVIFTLISRLDQYAEAIRAKGSNLMFRPYLSIIRMHVLIFVFAGLGIAGLSSYAVYPVLIFYFLPVRNLTAIFRRAKQ